MPYLRQLLKSKIHRATVTDANVDYIGSVTIDQDLMDACDLWPGELVHVWNVDNGKRFETYTIAGERGSGVIVINGAAALHVSVGHRVIIAAFALTDQPIDAKVVLVDDKNKITRYL